MNRALEYQLPAEYVLERVTPTAAELAFGFQHGWLRGVDLAKIIKEKERAGAPLTAAEREVASQPSHEPGEMQDHVRWMAVSDQPAESRARVWMFLLLAWLWDHRSQVPDPFEEIEMIYADLEFPEEMSGLVRFMPAAEGEETGLDAIDARWLRYLRLSGEEFAARGTG